MSEDSTPRLALALLQPGQAQKEMYHNEALVRIDLAVQAVAEAAGGATPPEAPAPGQCWIVGTAATGEWAGQEGALAGWTDAGWRFVAPFEGLRVWMRDSAEIAVFRAGEWRLGEVHGRLFVEGVQVVGPRAGAIAPIAGGTTVDAEARAAVSAILAALQHHGLIDPA